MMMIHVIPVMLMLFSQSNLPVVEHVSKDRGELPGSELIESLVSLLPHNDSWQRRRVKNLRP